MCVREREREKKIKNRRERGERERNKETNSERERVCVCICLRKSARELVELDIWHCPFKTASAKTNRLLLEE